MSKTKDLKGNQPKDRAQEFVVLCPACDEEFHGFDFDDNGVSKHFLSHGLNPLEVAVANALCVADFCDHFCCDLPPRLCRVKTMAKELRKEFEQEKALVVEGCASILQVDIDMYSRFAARSSEPTSTQEAKRAADLCGYRDAIRSSHPNHAAIKAEIEREAIEKYKENYNG